jgi:hypothetical protein
LSACETRSPLAQSPQLPRAADGEPVFPEPWAAEAFALSAILVSRGVADADTILALQQSWQRAAEATPHGMPIVRENDPLR